MMVFISAPFSHSDPEVKKQRIKTISDFCAELGTGDTVAMAPVLYGYSIIHFSRHPLPDDWTYWQKFCKVFMEKSDVVYVLNLPGWEYSEGVQNEIKLARDLEKPVYLVDFTMGEGLTPKILLNLSARIY